MHTLQKKVVDSKKVYELQILKATLRDDATTIAARKLQKMNQPMFKIVSYFLHLIEVFHIFMFYWYLFKLI